MTRWSRWVLRHKGLVALLWLAVLVPAALATSKVSDRLSQQVDLPGQKGYEANEAILRAYGTGGYQLPLVPVIGLPQGVTVDQPDARRTLGRAFAALARQPGTRVVSFATTGDRRFVGAGGRTTFGLVFVPQQPVLGGAGPPCSPRRCSAASARWRCWRTCSARPWPSCRCWSRRPPS